MVGESRRSYSAGRGSLGSIHPLICTADPLMGPRPTVILIHSIMNLTARCVINGRNELIRATAGATSIIQHCKSLPPVVRAQAATLYPRPYARLSASQCFPTSVQLVILGRYRKGWQGHQSPNESSLDKWSMTERCLPYSPYSRIPQMARGQNQDACFITSYANLSALATGYCCCYY